MRASTTTVVTRSCCVVLLAGAAACDGSSGTSPAVRLDARSHDATELADSNDGASASDSGHTVGLDARPFVADADGGHATPDAGSLDATTPAGPCRGTPPDGGVLVRDAGDVDGGPYVPDCRSCRPDGFPCSFSINCAAGSICNDPNDPLYDPSEPGGICLRYICAQNGDCAGGRVCGLNRLCVQPVCTTAADCPGSDVCAGGACVVPLSATAVHSCAVVGTSGFIGSGEHWRLRAMVQTACGEALTEIDPVWLSSDPNVVSVNGDQATAGPAAGAATLTARAGGVSCAGQLELTNPGAAPAGSVRVAIRTADGQRPSGAEVRLITGGGEVSGTTIDGLVMFQRTGVPDSITVLHAGWTPTTIIAPGRPDVFVTLERLPDRTRAGGFRGSVDVGRLQRSDVRIAFSGASLSEDLGDLGLARAFCEPIDTVVDAPDLGLNNELIDMAGGTVFALGSMQFTDDPVRCVGTSPGRSQVGCFAASGLPGPQAAWTLAASLRLSEITPLAGGGSVNALFGCQGFFSYYATILGRFWHGAASTVDIVEHPKTNRPTRNGDCSDPSLQDYDDRCMADVAQLQRLDLRAQQALAVRSVVSVPGLPTGAGGSCPPGVVVVASVDQPGRGVVPLGFGVGIDDAAGGAADCVIDGSAEPFGPNSAPLAAGSVALHAAPPHSGLEAGDLAIHALAFDATGTWPNRLELSALVQRPGALGAAMTVFGPFMPIPQASVARATGVVTLAGAPAGATMLRLELSSGGASWVLYAPGSATRIAPPSVTGAPVVTGAAMTARLRAIALEAATYADAWGVGAADFGRRATAYSVADCADVVGASCALQ